MVICTSNTSDVIAMIRALLNGGCPYLVVVTENRQKRATWRKVVEETSQWKGSGDPSRDDFEHPSVRCTLCDAYCVLSGSVGQKPFKGDVIIHTDGMAKDDFQSVMGKFVQNLFEKDKS